MAGYLQAYQSAFVQGRFQGILSLVEQLRNEGIIRDDQELRNVVQELSTRLREGTQFRPRFDPERIRSDDINGNFQEIFLDLFGLYTHITRMDASMRSQQVSSRGLRQRIRKAIHRISQDVRQFQFLRDNPEYTEVKFVDFADTRNLFGGLAAATVDQYSRTLRLNSIRQDRQNELRGVGATTMTTEVLANGAVNAASRSFQPENALDQDQRSFWAEVLLSDDILTTTYQDDQGTDITVPGVVVRSTIRFDKPNLINNIQILPFGPYPMKVLDIRFDGVSWSGWSDQDPSYDWIDFTGIRKPVENLEIYFQQPNYSLVNYLMPKWAYTNAQLWDQLIDDDLEDRYVAEAESDLEIRDALTNPGLSSLIRANREFQDILADRDPDTVNQPKRVQRIVDAVVTVLDSENHPIVELLSTTEGRIDDSRKEQDYIEIDKVEYILGAFSIVTSDVEYAPLAGYDSPRFAVLNSLVEVELDVDERHIVAAGEDPLTSIEYNLVLGEDTSVPVFPVGTTAIEQEFLISDPANKTAYTRFTPTGDVSVYVNGALVGTVTPVGKAVDLDSVSGHTYSPDNIYTANYAVNSADATIDVPELFDSREHSQFFTDTDQNGLLELEFLPHVVYDIVNDIDRWNREDPLVGIWTVDPEGVAVNYDGVSYGFASGTLDTALSSGGTSIVLSSGDGANFSDKGTVRIPYTSGGSTLYEYIRYDSKTGDTLTDLVRGFDGTEVVAHSAGATVELVAEDEYEPVAVFVNGEKAQNITDYRLRNHPAFANVENPDAAYQFVHIGRRIYLNKQVTSANIEVRYRYLAEYVAMRIFLRNHQLATVTRTPIVDRFSLRLKTETR